MKISINVYIYTYKTHRMVTYKIIRLKFYSLQICLKLFSSSLFKAEIGNLWPSQPFYAARHMIWESANARRVTIF
jgi:hypothetical protein